MNRLRWLALLMGVAIVGITSFQLYWLKQNYVRERKTLKIKTEAAFRETITQLQVAGLNLDGMSLNGNVIINETGSINSNEEAISTINIIQTKLKNSLKTRTDVQDHTIIAMKRTGVTPEKDSIKFHIELNGPDAKKENIFNFLHGVDSLQRPLRTEEIDSAYNKALQVEKLGIPFSIIKKADINSTDERKPNEVTVGFTHPITYQLKLGNTLPYLIKQIIQPILYSIFLLGITLLSFVLLYKNLLRQKRLAALKNEFIGNITHELKTPIATVGVAIEALRNFGAAQSPEKTKEYLDISAAELQRLGLLVDKVLKISMLENGKIELKKENFDIRELIQEVVNIMKPQFEKCQAKVNIIIQGEKFIIEADRLHITSVIYNLLDNALKYSKENPAIDVHLSSLPNEIIELKVSDNGIGIPKEYQSKLFDKFFRVPAGNMHNVKGYGLGLSYVKEIVTAHKGYIVVESESGKGSTFTIKLPFKEAPVIYFDDKRRIIKEKIK